MAPLPPTLCTPIRVLPEAECPVPSMISWSVGELSEPSFALMSRRAFVPA
jgi:hypothetical protein